MQPESGYARLGDDRIAYHVLGEGPTDLVYWGLARSASPRAAGAFITDMLASDARSILPSIHVPTLIIHKKDYAFVPVEHAHYLAERIAGARMVELPGIDAVAIWDDPDGTLGAIRDFLAEVNPQPSAGARVDRVLATVLFTDIVSSTERARAIGDREWKARLAR